MRIEIGRIDAGNVPILIPFFIGQVIYLTVSARDAL